ncbi:MAG: ABC transporter substrate-binding protein [Flavobacteriales bacterium]
MKKIKIALDWTPNINHLGILIAKELGFYKELGLDVEVVSPITDNYTITPGKKLELGMVDFAIAPFETVISLNNKKNVVEAVAVFAILQKDTSSIATLASSNITKPSLLDGKTYASYKARYEDHIVNELIKNDGGQGKMSIIYPEKLGIWDTLLTGKADSTWIFNNWEGIEANTKQIELNKFSMDDFGIPYCYSPVIITNNESLKQNKIQYSDFIKATRKGYLFVGKNKLKAAEILKSHVTAADKENIDIEQAIDFTIPYFGEEANCGIMQQERVDNFTHWLVQQELENEKIKTQNLFTNELIG